MDDMEQQDFDTASNDIVCDAVKSNMYIKCCSIPQIIGECLSLHTRWHYAVN